MLYNLSNSDLLLLKETEKILREHKEDATANDISLLKGRIEYLINNNKYTG